MIRVVAPSRLHFGLLRVPTDGWTGRRFGGCGLAIDSPDVVVRAAPAAAWNAVGPLASRAVEFARRVTSEPHFVHVERAPPEHVGLGTGTALGLAVARAIRPHAAAADLARLVGRGLRSGVGLYGFAHGGFIVDRGKDADDALPDLASRHPFPSDWRVAYFVPDEPAEWHGPRERAAFARPRSANLVERTAEAMEGLLFREIVPGLAAADYDRFGDALHEYNRLAGTAFAEEQGGTYVGPSVEELVEAARELGARGVGQSSWGPTVFAILPDPDRAQHIADVIRERFAGLRAVGVAEASAAGATVERLPQDDLDESDEQHVRGEDEE